MKFKHIPDILTEDNIHYIIFIIEKLCNNLTLFNGNVDTIFTNYLSVIFHLLKK